MAIILATCTNQNSNDKDWPQYRNNAGRTGFTTEQIDGNLAPVWVHNFGPADKSWTGIHTRMTFDYAIQPVISGNYLYAGNSNDNQIYAINRKTGKVI